jgi:hypothetical protein
MLLRCGQHTAGRLCYYIVSTVCVSANNSASDIKIAIGRGGELRG